MGNEDVGVFYEELQALLEEYNVRGSDRFSTLTLLRATLEQGKTANIDLSVLKQVTGRLILLVQRELTCVRVNVCQHECVGVVSDADAVLRKVIETHAMLTMLEGILPQSMDIVRQVEVLLSFLREHGIALSDNTPLALRELLCFLKDAEKDVHSCGYVVDPGSVI
jgi:hypothetical protein